ncbi:unnamed protein product [Caenorhabditis brenneri]
MSLHPKRAHSTTRLDHRSNGLSIYYKRGNADVEEEMIRVTVINEGETNPDDTLRSSKSSESVCTTEKSSSSAASSGKSDKKKKERKKASRSSKVRPTSYAKQYKARQRGPLHFDSLDQETMRVLDDLKLLNSRIRMRFHIGPSPSHTENMEKLNKNKQRNLKTPSTSSRATSNSSYSSSCSSSTVSCDSPPHTARIISQTNSTSSSPVRTAQAFDYCGRPLKPQLDNTPFPNAISTNTRKEANEFFDRKKKKKEVKPVKSDTSTTSSDSSSSKFIKPPVPPVAMSSGSSSSSVSSIKKKKETPTTSKILNLFKATNPPSETSSSSGTPPVKLTRVSSDSKFPGARSPATRRKVRLLLKECARKKREIEKELAEMNMNEEKNNVATVLKAMVREKNKKKEEMKKTESNHSSLRTIYSKSEMTIGCNSCCSCVECITTCDRNHVKKEVREKTPKKEKSTIESQKTSEKSRKSTKSSKKSKKSRKSVMKRIRRSKKRRAKKYARSTSSSSMVSTTTTESIDASSKSNKKKKVI